MDLPISPTRVTSVKVAPNMADPISIKYSVRSLKIKIWFLFSNFYLSIIIIIIVIVVVAAVVVVVLVVVVVVGVSSVG